MVKSIDQHTVVSFNCENIPIIQHWPNKCHIFVRYIVMGPFLQKAKLGFTNYVQSKSFEYT